MVVHKARRPTRLWPLILGLAALTLAACATSTTSDPTSTPADQVASTTTAEDGNVTVTTETPVTTTIPVASTIETPTTSAEVQAVDSGSIAPDGAYGSGCNPGPGPLPDGVWFGFVVARYPEAIDFDLACFIPRPLVDGEIVNANAALRSVSVDGDIPVRALIPPEPTYAETTYANWQPEACQFEDGAACAVWIRVLDGRVIDIQEEFFS